MRLATLVLAALTLMTQPASAGERETLGFGRLFTNDYLGDGNDRWRTGSYVVSWMRGASGTSDRGTFGEVLEYRFGASIITPASLTNPVPGDRRYAGTLSFGLHSHFRAGAFEMNAGADLVFTGPQTGISGFQEDMHDLFGATPPSPAVLAGQIPDRIMPTALFEAAHPFRVGPATLRPFIEAQAGVETLVRIGGDVLIGQGYRQGILVRDVTTGQLYQSLREGHDSGLSFLLGADVAHVAHSAYLPTADGYDLTGARTRARAGMQWQADRFGMFYGVTWLGEEFEAQPEGQLLGSVNLRLDF